jgi:hypothetical protein
MTPRVHIKFQARTRNYHGKKIPTATAVELADCQHDGLPHCHLIGLDENDEPFCEIVVEERMVNYMLDHMAHGGQEKH